MDMDSDLIYLALHVLCACVCVCVKYTMHLISQKYMFSKVYDVFKVMYNENHENTVSLWFQYQIQGLLVHIYDDQLFCNLMG